MINEILAYIGSGIIIIWGIAHIIPTKSIVQSFGELSGDNKRILLMEWVAEGLTLIFIGGLVLVWTILCGSKTDAAQYILAACTIMLLIMAAWSLFTGARTSIIPMKLCPLVKTIVAIMFIMAIVL